MSLLFELQRKRSKKDKNKSPFPLIFGIENDDGSPSWQTFRAVLTAEGICVKGSSDCNTIYSSGFFGRGSLSKSKPTYEDRSLKITKERFQRHETFYEDLVSGKEELPDQISLAPIGSKNVRVVSFESEDDLMPSMSTSMPDPLPMVESLILSPEEAYFLSGAMKCLIVSRNGKDLNLDELWRACIEIDARFPLRYAAYHHFRSKGWVIRMAMTYGADYLLYKDGPPFYHATFSVTIRGYLLPNLTPHPLLETCPSLERLQDLEAMNRCHIQVSKTVLFCEVIVEPDISLDSPKCLDSLYIQEIVSKRWCPNEARL